jgi:hypothetical protein
MHGKTTIKIRHRMFGCAHVFGECLLHRRGVSYLILWFKLN